jgi:hypothetical protein
VESPAIQMVAQRQDSVQSGPTAGSRAASAHWRSQAASRARGRLSSTRAGDCRTLKGPTSETARSRAGSSSSGASCRSNCRSAATTRGDPAVWREVATGRRRATLLGRASAFPDAVSHHPRWRPGNPSQNVVTRTYPHERLETSQIGPFLFLLAILWPPTHGDLPYLVMKQPP